MPSAEIITIGTEILLGEILDTNAQFIARKFRDVGIDLYRKTTVGDNTGRIAQAIRQSTERCDIILTTGGLGPTIDDPTREAIALAIGKKTEFQPQLWVQIQERFQRYGRQPTENNKRQAYIPGGAIPVENPVGTAPAFIVELEENRTSIDGAQSQGKTIIALPGVPQEMEYLLEQTILPYLRSRYQLTGIIKARTIHTVGIGESQIDALIGELETFSNPTVGLAAHSGQVDVRITAKAESESKADELIGEVENVLRTLLNSWIYGADEDTLEDTALQALEKQGLTLGTIESGLNGNLIRRLSIASQNWQQSKTSPFRGGEVITGLPSIEELSAMTAACREKLQVDVGLGVAIYPQVEKQDVSIVLITPSGRQEFIRPFGGPPEYAPRWALHHSLDIIRKI
jgi:nicotinamide-nucleotide amidase